MVEADKADSDLPLPLPSGSVPSPPPRQEVKAFYTAHGGPLIKALRMLGATEVEAQDAVSEAMREVLTRWHDLTNPAAWVRVAATSNFRKLRRRQSRDVLVGDVESGRRDGADDPGLTVWEDREWVDGLLAVLPPGQRQVMELIVEGYRPAEIATLLGNTPAAVRKSLQHARARLSPHVQRELGLPRQQRRVPEPTTRGEDAR